MQLRAEEESDREERRDGQKVSRSPRPTRHFFGSGAGAAAGAFPFNAASVAASFSGARPARIFARRSSGRESQKPSVERIVSPSGRNVRPAFSARAIETSPMPASSPFVETQIGKSPSGVGRAPSASLPEPR